MKIDTRYLREMMFYKNLPHLIARQQEQQKNNTILVNVKFNGSITGIKDVVFNVQDVQRIQDVITYIREYYNSNCEYNYLTHIEKSLVDKSDNTKYNDIDISITVGDSECYRYLVLD